MNLHHRLNNKGLTLIELLIVMLIISIVAGVAAITINRDQHKQYEMLAEQLVDKIQLAKQEAMVRQTTLGLAFSKHLFQFYIYQHNEKTGKATWQAITESALGPHGLPRHVQVTVKMHDEIIPTDGRPAIIISPSNELTPFILLIGKVHEQPDYQVVGFANGDIKSEIFHAQ